MNKQNNKQIINVRDDRFVQYVHWYSEQNTLQKLDLFLNSYNTFHSSLMSQVIRKSSQSVDKLQV